MISKNSFKKAWNNRKLVGGALKAAHVRPDYHLYEDLFQKGLIVYAEMIEELTPQKDNKEIDKLSFRDDQGRVYDIEMQTTNKHDLEERMQYYAAGLNHFTLKSGQSYKELKSSYVVFFCTFDPYKQGESMYEFNFFDRRTKTMEFNADMHIKVFNSKGKSRDLNQKMLDFLDYMNGIINHDQGYIADLQKSIDYYVNSGKWVSDMDKLSYEMNKVAEKATKKVKKEDVIAAIKMLQRLHFSCDDVLDNILQSFGNSMSKAEIERLVKENY